MSRETDSSSSGGTQGRGGAAYPSGTPPYGTRPFPSLHPQERQRTQAAPGTDGDGVDGAAGGPSGPSGPSARGGQGGGPQGAGEDGARGTGGAGARPRPADEPRTETTLTTRIRINIPGSRPIPPVVMRTPVDDKAAAAGSGSGSVGSGSGGGTSQGSATRSASASASASASGTDAGPAAGAGTGGPGAAGGTGGAREGDAAPEKKGTSDWFAPRKPVSQQPGSQQQGPQSGAPSASAGAPGGTPSFGGPAGAGAGAGAPGVPGADALDDPFAEAFTSPPAADPYATGPFTGAGAGGDGPAVPGVSQGSGPYDAQAADFPSPFGTEDFPPGVPRPSDPFAPGDPAAPADGFGQGPGGDPFAAPGGPGTDPFAGRPGGSGDPYGAPGAPGRSQGPRPDGPGAGDDPFAEYRPGAGPTTGPVTGTMQVPPVGAAPGSARPFAPGSGADSAFGSGPDPFGGPGGGGPGGGADDGGFRPGPAADRPSGDSLSGDTLVSGIPVVPPGEARGPRSPGSGPQAVPERLPHSPDGPSTGSEPASSPPSGGKSAPPRRKGRSKIALLGVAVGTVAVVAYGAGLLMNHSDVPKGTTVLGVDIGNMSQATAVQTLDKALGNRATAPLTLTIGGRKQALKPSVAGLSVDTDATVRKVAHPDYNPVSVIGSLFGGSRIADPVYMVDNDKLKSALKTLAGANSTSTDGMVRFADHKAVAVPGKPGTSFDVDSAATAVAAAYRTRAETGADQPVVLRTTTVPPKVGQAELDKAVNGFGKTAMMGAVTVSDGKGHSIRFNTTIPQFLTMRPDQTGTLQPHVDLKALKALYGQTFDADSVKRSDGSVTPVTAQDVAVAVIQALGSATDRTVVLHGVR